MGKSWCPNNAGERLDEAVAGICWAMLALGGLGGLVWFVGWLVGLW